MTSAEDSYQLCFFNVIDYICNSSAILKPFNVFLRIRTILTHNLEDNLVSRFEYPGIFVLSTVDWRNADASLRTTSETCFVDVNTFFDFRITSLVRENEFKLFRCLVHSSSVLANLHRLFSLLLVQTTYDFLSLLLSFDFSIKVFVFFRLVLSIVSSD